jgi:hypothetical protein
MASSDPSRPLSFRAGNGSSCPEADLCSSWSPEIQKAVESSHPSSAMSICSDWKLQPLSHQKVMNLT